MVSAVAIVLRSHEPDALGKATLYLDGETYSTQSLQNFFSKNSPIGKVGSTIGWGDSLEVCLDRAGLGQDGKDKTFLDVGRQWEENEA